MGSHSGHRRASVRFLESGFVHTEHREADKSGAKISAAVQTCSGANLGNMIHHWHSLNTIQRSQRREI